MYHETIKIRDISPESIAWKKVRSALNQAAIMIGSVSVLSNDEYYLMKDFLMTEYKDFSAEEMLIAFKKVSSGSIAVDMQHFGKLSPMYLGSVLKAFKIERHKALAQELKDKPKEIVIASQEDKLKARAEFLDKCLIKPYKEIKEKGFFDIDNHIAVTLYKLFIRAGLIKVSDQEDQDYHKRAISELQKEAENDFDAHKPLQKFFESIKAMNQGKDDSTQKTVTGRACALYFIDYVMKLHKANRDIELVSKQL